MMCQSCTHAKVCKYTAEYEAAVKLVDISKITYENIIIEAYCPMFKHAVDGFPVIKKDKIMNKVYDAVPEERVYKYDYE